MTQPAGLADRLPRLHGMEARAGERRCNLSAPAPAFWDNQRSLTIIAHPKKTEVSKPVTGIGRRPSDHGPTSQPLCHKSANSFIFMQTPQLFLSGGGFFLYQYVFIPTKQTKIMSRYLSRNNSISLNARPQPNVGLATNPLPPGEETCHDTSGKPQKEIELRPKRRYILLLPGGSVGIEERACFFHCIVSAPKPV